MRYLKAILLATLKKPGSSNNNAIMLPYLKGEKCSRNLDHNGFFWAPAKWRKIKGG